VPNLALDPYGWAKKNPYPEPIEINVHGGNQAA
jgi:hypothetical protein